jgi:hypothetical protein
MLALKSANRSEKLRLGGWRKCEIALCYLLAQSRTHGGVEASKKFCWEGTHESNSHSIDQAPQFE